MLGLAEFELPLGAQAAVRAFIKEGGEELALRQSSSDLRPAFGLSPPAFLVCTHVEKPGRNIRAYDLSGVTTLRIGERECMLNYGPPRHRDTRA